MSSDAVNEAARSVTANAEDGEDLQKLENEKTPKTRRVCFPTDDQLVTKYFEPANPWHDLPTTTRDQLALEYIDSCNRHATTPIDGVIDQIKELPENTIGGATRACRLLLTSCLLIGPSAVDALEALLRKVQFRRLTVEHCAIDDEGAEALFDMIEYYESAVALALTGPRDFNVRGWQAASRMIKKSAELSELEASDWPLEESHAAVLSRSLKPHTCRLTSLCVQRARLAGESLLCLVIALKSNRSVRELRLGDNALSPADALQLGSLLRANVRLHTLDLSNNCIQDAGVGHLADALSAQAQAAMSPPSAGSSPGDTHYIGDGYEPRGLVYFILWNNQLTRNCGGHLSRVLRASPSLCVLNVGRNALGGELLGSLRPPPASLGLQGARLGPDAARPLATLLREARTLQRLDLRDNKLGCEGLQAILSAMQDNNTLTQIDLDDYPEQTTLSVENSDDATCARLTKSILALCKRNEPVPSSAAHRKISLTCHTLARPPVEPAPRRLRSPLPSPAPSPAGSPVPGAAPNSRFSVTRVTPERESSGESSSPSTPTTPTRPAASRFRVMQVAEPPRIQVQSDSTPRRTASRFSVTRNYDTSYNPAKAKQADCTSLKSEKIADKSDKVGNKTIKLTETSVKVAETSVKVVDLSEKTVDASVTKPVDAPIVIIDKCQSDNKEEVISDKVKVDKNSDNKSDKYTDKTEKISHNEIITSKGDDNLLITETKLVKNTTEISPSEKVDMKIEVTVTKASAIKEQTKAHSDQNKVEKETVKENVAMKQIVAITEDLGNLIQEMQQLSTKTSVLTKKSEDLKTAGPVNVNVVLKKNKSESSLDSPDLEVSRLMKKVEAFCDSSSSLEVSGSSMESLNTELDRRKVIERETVDLNLLNTSTSSNESVSPIFDKKNESISSLDASVSSIDSRNDIQMVTSADSGIEYSLRKEEGTLTQNITLNEETLTNSPKRDATKKPERTRKISWVAPSSSFQIQREPEKVEAKLPTNLEKLLSLFQHPSSLFSRSDDEKKINVPIRKESANLTSSFWSWGTQNPEKEESDDSTLSERVQVSYVDESFSKKLDSKTPSTDTDNTLSEFHSLPILGNSESDVDDDVTVIKTTEKVQSLDLESNSNSKCDSSDLNDVNKNVCESVVRPRSFAAVLKASGSENSLKQSSPDSTTVDKLPSKVIREIKENISPENSLTSTTKSLALELYETEKNPVASVWEENEKVKKDVSTDSGAVSLEETKVQVPIIGVDLGRDALAYLEDFEPNELDNVVVQKAEVTLSDELRDAELKEMLDLSPELVIDDLSPEVFKEKCLRASPIIPAKLKKSNSLEALPGISETKADSPKKKNIVFNVPETSSTPRDIPKPRKLRSRSGSSPKSLPESFKHASLSKIEHTLTKKKKKVSSLGKIAKDSLLALNMTEDEIADFRRSYKLTSVESLRSLESVSEDANSQSGNSEGKCRCLRLSQESLMSLDSISEDCKCDKGESR